MAAKKIRVKAEKIASAEYISELLLCGSKVYVFIK